MTWQCHPQVHTAGHAEVRHLESYDIHGRHLIEVTSDEKTLRNGATPTCVISGQSKRKCQDSSLQLRWPNANDSRRAIVWKSPPNRTTGHTYTSESHFVHMTPLDVEMHYRLTALGPWPNSELFTSSESTAVTVFRLTHLSEFAASPQYMSPLVPAKAGGQGQGTAPVL